MGQGAEPRMVSAGISPCSRAAISVSILNEEPGVLVVSDWERPVSKRFVARTSQ